jgi:hypothetical protein
VLPWRPLATAPWKFGISGGAGLGKDPAPATQRTEAPLLRLGQQLSSPSQRGLASSGPKVTAQGTHRTEATVSPSGRWWRKRTATDPAGCWTMQPKHMHELWRMTPRMSGASCSVGAAKPGMVSPSAIGRGYVARAVRLGGQPTGAH